MIPKTLIELHAPEIGRGETIRINHEDCAEGSDTRRRLYLTRPASSAGVVLAFCHNCQQHGVLRDRAGNYRDYHQHYKPAIKEVEFEIPPHLVAECDDWPTVANIWRHNKGLTKKQCWNARIQYDPDSHRIYIPQYKQLAADGTPFSEDELMGYQLRHLDGPGAKYLTATKDSNTKPYTRIKPAPKEVCVLVEDLASGLAIANAHDEAAVVVNYGVKVTPETLYNNVNCTDYIVWLDNDGQTVRTQAEGIARTWAMLNGGQNPRVISNYRDPKHYKSQEIRDIIDGRQPRP